MATTKFIIRRKKINKEGKAPIYLQYTHNGKTLQFSTQEKIKPGDWNDRSGKPKSLKNRPDLIELHDAIKPIEETIQSIVRNARATGKEPVKEYVKRQYESAVKGIVSEKGFTDYFQQYIDASATIKSKAIVSVYRYVLNDLINFSKSKRVALEFDNINAHFYDRFVKYLIKDLHNFNNTVGKKVKTLKSFLNWATERGYNKKMDYKKFKVYREETDIIYLKEGELINMYEYNFSKNKRLEAARDLFCLECFTGLRYSDASQLKPGNIHEDYIMVRFEKTDDPQRVPLNDYSKELLAKYGNEDGRIVPPRLSNQKLNYYIKEVAEIVGIDETTTITRKKGNEKVKETAPKFSFISTHTGRRTFVTLSLEKGMRPEVLMTITGHRTLRSFQRYIKIIDQVRQEEMARVWSRVSA